MKLRTRLIRLSVAALLPVVALSAILIASLIDRERSSRRQGMVDLARTLSLALDAELRRTETALEVLAASNSLGRGDLATFEHRARFVLSRQALWSNVLVFDADARPLLNVSRSDLAPALPLSDASIVQRTIESVAPQVSDVLRNTETGRPLVIVTAPFLRDGIVRGVLSAAMDYERWTPWLIERLPTGWTAGIGDRRNVIIGRSSKADQLAGRPASAPIQTALSERSEGWTKSVGLEQVLMYTAFHRSSFSGWYLAALVPAAVVDRDAYYVAGTLTVGALVLILAAALLAAYHARSLERAMSRLRDAVRSLGTGAKPRVEPTGIDEIDATLDATRQADLLLKERAERVTSLQSALQQRAEQAEQANRAKDDFLAMLGHELRNPLAAITNATAVLQRLHDKPPSPAMLQILSRQSASLGALVDQLLDVSRLARGKVTVLREPVDLAEVARNAVEVMRAAGRLKSHRLTVKATPAWTSGDSARLEQVARNLIDNAVKFTPPGKAISVLVDSSGREAVLRVCDEGPGIPTEAVRDIFEPFVQAPQNVARSAGGMGVGLAIVKQLVELHHGTIEVHAREGGGSEFVVRLPEADEEAPQGETERTRSAPGRRRVLIVEDQPDARESLRSLLECEGHEVLAAADGEEGLQRLLSEKPDLALIDIGLPKRDGYDVAGSARRNGIGTALIALTGYGQSNDRERALASGFDGFLVKPASREQLLATITSIERAPG